MTTEEINEIQTAVDHIHHVCIDDPLPGKYYDLCRAVLPVLEGGLLYNMSKEELIGDTYKDAYCTGVVQGYYHRHALSIARAINQKQRMTIIEDKGKKDVKTGTKTAAEYTAKMPKYKTKLHPEVLKKLKQEGRIIEKGKGK